MCSAPLDHRAQLEDLKRLPVAAPSATCVKSAPPRDSSRISTQSTRHQRRGDDHRRDRDQQVERRVACVIASSVPSTVSQTGERSPRSQSHSPAASAQLVTT